MAGLVHTLWIVLVRKVAKSYALGMSLTETSIADAAFVTQVAKNIRTVLRFRDLSEKAAARLIAMSSAVFSQRINGHSRWLAHELADLSRKLGVPADVIFAADDDEFRQAFGDFKHRCHSDAEFLQEAFELEYPDRHKSALHHAA